MPISDLFQVSMRDYIAGLAETGSLWIFQHIPKTAGTSLSNEFGQHMAPYRNIFIDYEDKDTPFVQRMSDAVDRFIAELRHVDIRSCSGHLTADLVGRIQLARPDARVVTFLRNPVSRVISDYRYQCSDMHPGNDEFRKAFPRIEDYVESRVSQNKMCLMIHGHHPEMTAQMVIDQINQRFAFVGLVEMYAMSFSCMFAAMGRPGMVPHTHARKTPDTQETRVEITQALRDRIGEVNQLDLAIYDHVHDLLLRHRDNWWKGAPVVSKARPG